MRRVLAHAWRAAIAIYGAIADRPRVAVLLAGLLALGASTMSGLLIGIAEPRINDEFSYLLAADTFAHGRLANPAHPLWVHFESMHIIQQPTYASKFPPAQGLILAAGQAAVGLPVAGVWLSVGLMVAAICWMLYAWLPPRWAVLGGLIAALHIGILSDWAQGYWGGAVAATGGALVFGALRRICARPERVHAVFLGIGLAVLANSRPYEGLIASLPAGVILVGWMLGRQRPPFGVAVSHVVLPLVVVLALAGAAMGYYNYRVTGDPLRLPYQIHAAAYRVEPIFLTKPPLPEPVYRHAAIRDFHTKFELGFYDKQHPIGGYGFRVIKLDQFIQLWRFYLGYLLSLPLLLLPWVVRDRWFRFALVTCGVVAAGLAVETWILHHYAAPATALVIAVVVGCLREWHRRDPAVGRFIVALVVVLSAGWTAMTLASRLRDGEPPAWHERRAALLAELTAGPGRHLVVVRYGPAHYPQNEWVYNGADIDGARVVWAREMDEPDNRRLLEYFEGRQPWLLVVDSDAAAPVVIPYPSERSRN